MDFFSALSLEEKGDSDKALLALNEIIKNNTDANISEYLIDALRRMTDRIDGRSLMENLNVLPFENNEFFISESNERVESENLPSPIVTLTTISTRIKGVFKTIESLKKQDLSPRAINLYVSEDPYLVDEGFARNDENLKKISRMGVNIFFTKNIGPYRKQYPLIKQLHEQEAPGETIFITVDDDVIYPANTLRKLVKNLELSESVTAYRGREIKYNEHKISDYKDFSKPKVYSSLKNLGTGRNGIAYRLKFFPKKYELYIGPIVAPTADDLWCKWITSMYCIPTAIIEPNAAFDPLKDFKEVAPEDKIGLFHVFNASGRNDIAIKALEIFFNKYKVTLFDILRRI